MTDFDRTQDLIRAYYAAFNRGDREAMLDLLADDVVHDLNQGPRETGRETFGPNQSQSRRGRRRRLDRGRRREIRRRR